MDWGGNASIMHNSLQAGRKRYRLIFSKRNSATKLYQYTGMDTEFENWSDKKVKAKNWFKNCF